MQCRSEPVSFKGTYECHQEVPRDVVDAHSEPLGPHLEQQEEESQANHEGEHQVLLDATVLVDEHVDACSADHLFRQRLHVFRSLGLRGFGVRIHTEERHHANHLSALDHDEAKTHRVLNRLQTVQPVTFVDGLADLEDLNRVRNDVEMQLIGFER